MSSKKEEERNEKIIRGLMKLPPNRRCINCNSMGPQYVCTNFWTFVCMSCSGIHREFTHRVKSVSMSKFTSQEVEALQEGGNQRARETYLKGWDPRQQRLPDSSNAEKVREFIKSVYVDRKYYSAKTSGKPPRDALNHRNNEDDDRRASSYHSYSQSPPYDYQYEERRYGKQAPALTRKPGSDRGILRFFSSSRLSDHVQEDRFENELHNARVSDSSVNSGGVPFRSDAQSPASLRDVGFSSPSSEKSRDILSEDGQQSPVNTFLNLKGAGELHQRTGSSDSIGQMNTGGTGFKLVDSVGKELIAPTPEKSVVTHNNKDLAFPSLPNSSESGKFDGLDLFSATCQPQVITSAPPAIDLFQLPEAYSTLSVNGLQPPHSSTESTLNMHQQSEAFGPSSSDLSSVITSAPSALDFFQSPTYSALSVNGLQPPHSSTELTPNVHQQSKAFGPSSSDIGVMEQQHFSETLKDKSPDTMIQKSEGWATFDMPWHVEPIYGIESLAPATETSTSDKSLSKLDQALSEVTNPHWFFQDFGANLPSSSVHSQWHEGLHNIGVLPNAMDNQSWSSFEGSISPLQSIYTQSNEQVPDPSAADPYLAWEMSEDLQNVEIKKADLDARPPFHSTSSHASKSFDASFEHPVAAVHSHGLEQKSRNPFDTVYDSVPESSSMQSLDMSSLQSALPNHNMSTPWFPASTAIPYIPGRSQDAVVFLAGQAPSIQIPNIPSQGHVASISGNPFA